MILVYVKYDFFGTKTLDTSRILAVRVCLCKKERKRKNVRESVCVLYEVLVEGKGKSCRT